jgi:hypothetical protein
MEQVLLHLFQKNAEYGFEQRLKSGAIPEAVIMINQITRKLVSHAMAKVYKFAMSWTEAFTGKDLLDPTLLAKTYAQPDIQELIDLTAENYNPVPPSDPSDRTRTMLFAAERGGLGSVFL